MNSSCLVGLYHLFRRLISNFISVFSALSRRKWFRVSLPTLLAIFFSFWNFYHSNTKEFYLEFQLFDRGGFFLAGVPGNSTTFNMPFFEITIAALRHFGATVEHIFIILQLGVYGLVFLAGCMLYGYWAGIISLTAIGVFGVERALIYEQTFYSFFLLLILIFLLLKTRENTLKNSLFCGLAVGASLLVRTPLFLFPPIVIFCDWLYSRDYSRAFIFRSVVFLASSYVLLLPWGYLNKTLYGKFDVFDTNRAACNIITAAEGSVFTMEGDSRKLAELKTGETAFDFYLREWYKTPSVHALTVLRRLLAIFLFYPVLLTFFLFALVVSRKPDKIFVFCLPVYFILIHSLLSIEMRYFYPLPYLLIPIIVGGILSRFSTEVNVPYMVVVKWAQAAFWLSFGGVICTEALIIAYPFRISGVGAKEDLFTRAATLFPYDPILHNLKCRELWRKGDDTGFRNCIGTQLQGIEDIPGHYFSIVSTSSSPSKILLPDAYGNEKFYLQCLILRMLREFELGQREKALLSLYEAYSVFDHNYNRLQSYGGEGKHSAKQDAEPYEQDRQLARRIELDSDRFWNEFVYEMLLFWPPKRMVVIIPRLAETELIGWRLKTLLEKLSKNLSYGERGEHALRTELSAYWLPPTFIHSKSKKQLMEDFEISKKLSDTAVEKMRAEDFESAEKILLRALSINDSNPEALISLCVIQTKQGKLEQAIEACHRSAESVYERPEYRMPGFEMLAREAELQSYKLLNALGRKEAARKALQRAIKGFPVLGQGATESEATLDGGGKIEKATY